MYALQMLTFIEGHIEDFVIIGAVHRETGEVNQQLTGTFKGLHDALCLRL